MSRPKKQRETLLGVIISFIIIPAPVFGQIVYDKTIARAMDPGDVTMLDSFFNCLESQHCLGKSGNVVCDGNPSSPNCGAFADRVILASSIDRLKFTRKRRSKSLPRRERIPMVDRHVTQRIVLVAQQFRALIALGFSKQFDPGPVGVVGLNERLHMIGVDLVFPDVDVVGHWFSAP